MKIVKVKTTDGHTVEINPDAISEIIQVEKEDPGFLGLIGWHEAKYQIYLNDGHNYKIKQREHDKLQTEMD
ncbi:MAG: hypothetical protein QNJ47_07170 [Nostocaceae cyanobacterium]|nr:hypothetical protein [Nostocaceae cyanobacterium]